ncbi:alpha/beta-hydrolase [Patellaria atrata CBS 101060]|uniref:Alpha/beta-hydrolase n=1 Tax=Patellaria atrata CBS 101060 TaxID=1346257 RepID=A0A9P4SG37_9PEZI|nr:alpha/beta-hydrolase [Patellaria atrata CBS 101060]
MSSSLFRVKEHVIPCCHIREYPHATFDDQEEVLELAVKQYTPLDNPSPEPGDVTIIAAHANGFPKELYEPLWDELLKRANKAGFSIRGIWISDVAWQGKSGVLNEKKLGNDPCWFDHSRDLLGMVNHFRSEIKRPIVGVAHSMGGAMLVGLSLMHPRLFETMVLLDAVIQPQFSKTGNGRPAKMSAIRRERWASRKAAAESMKKSPFYQTWDPRVLDLWIEHGLRDLPDEPPSQTSHALPPSTTEPTLTPRPEPPVTLTTARSQEVFTFLRPNYIPSDPSTPGPHNLTTSNTHIRAYHNRLTHPDITPTSDPQSPFYRPEPIRLFHNLPHLRPSALFVGGELSDLTSANKFDTAGTGIGGSGGKPEGMVEEVVIKGAGHLIPMEKVDETADVVAEWIARQMRRWRVLEAKERREWATVPEKERSVMSAYHVKTLTQDFGKPIRVKEAPKL